MAVSVKPPNYPMSRPLRVRTRERTPAVQVPPTPVPAPHDMLAAWRERYSGERAEQHERLLQIGCRLDELAAGPTPSARFVIVATAADIGTS